MFSRGKGGARIQTRLLCLQLWSVLGIVWSRLALGRTGKDCVLGREEDNLDRSLLQVFHLVGTALGAGEGGIGLGTNTLELTSGRGV